MNDGMPNDKDVEDTTERHLGDTKKMPLKKKMQAQMKKGAFPPKKDADDKPKKENPFLKFKKKTK